MADPSTRPFGQALRRRRLAAGLSQEELAEQAGLSVRGVRALEAGHRSTPGRKRCGCWPTPAG